VTGTSPVSSSGDRYGTFDDDEDNNNDDDLDHQQDDDVVHAAKSQQQIIDMLSGDILGAVGGSSGGARGVSATSLNRLVLPRRKLSTASSSSSSSSSSSASSARSSPQNATMSKNNSNTLLNTNTNKTNEFVDFDEIAENPEAILLDFKSPLSDEKEVEWRTLFLHGNLYVQIPASCLPEGSRDSFISLLEFAEQKLECERVFACFERKRQDRNDLMRVFMFLGFTVVPPNNPMVPQNDDIMSMVYNID
jgi:ornithine decarboxylase antizyme 1